jgi:hypothetical protein
VADPSKDRVTRTVLALHGRTFADELGIDAGSGAPAALFRLLCASLLFSARIDATIASRAARSLFDRGWTTARKLAASTWNDRVAALHDATYTRYQEQTAANLGDTAIHLLDRYGGDLRRLREQADRQTSRERALLKECKGIGDVGVDIFFREVQSVWSELRPFADDRALAAARRLGLGDDPQALAGLVEERDLARFVAGLVRIDLADDSDRVMRVAAGDEDPLARADIGELERRTKKQLYARAQDIDLPGRSSMTKDELIEALAKADGEHT